QEGPAENAVGLHLQQRIGVHSFVVFGGYEGFLSCRFVQLVDAGDVGMAQSPHHVDLSAQLLQRPRVLAQFQVQKGQNNRLVLHFVVRQPDMEVVTELFVEDVTTATDGLATGQVYTHSIRRVHSVARKFSAG